MKKLLLQIQSLIKKTRIDKKDLIFLIFIIFITLLAGELPLIAALLSQNSSSHFTGVLPYAPGDYLIYYNFIEQSRQGTFFFSDFFTSEPHVGVYFSPFWMILGKIAHILSLSNQAIYEISKIFFGIIGITATFLFIKRIFTHRKLVYFATITAIFSGGITPFIGPYINWIVKTVTENQALFYPIDSYAAEVFLVTLFAHSGLFALSFTLFITTLWIFVSKKQSKLRSNALVIFPFILGFIHTYDLIPLCTTALLFIVYKKTQRRLISNDIRKYIYMLIGAVPPVLYLGTLFIIDPVLNGWSSQNSVEMRLLFPTLAGFGLLIPLSIFGMHKAFTEKNEKLIALSLWAISALILSFSPLPFQRKIIQGISFPLGILSAASVYYFFQSSKKISNDIISYCIQGVLITGTIITLFLSQAYSVIYEVYDYSHAVPPYFISTETKEALEFLKNNTNTSDIILASPIHSQYIPGLYYRKSYVADEHQTLDYARKKKEFIVFTQYQNNTEWKKEFLQKNNISYFYYDKLQKKPRDISFENVPYLKNIFENEEIILYKIEL